MRHTLQTVSILLCVACAAATGAEAPFTVGQQWTYRHTGPKPGSFEPNAIDGQRIAQVIGEDPNHRLWIIEERYTNSSDPVGRLHIDRNRMVVAIEIESGQGPPGLLQYDPPVPYEAPDLAVGRKATIETTLRMDSPKFSMPTTLEFERLADETVETDAGTFETCRHYRMTSRATFDLRIAKVPVSEERHRWFHPRANGLVKETYHREPVKFLSWSRPGYDASSILTAFGIEAVFETTAPAERPPASSSHSTQTRPGGILLLIVAVAVAAMGVLLLGRRSAKRPGANSDRNL
ncbi:MAG TPA: hypothetical protein PLU87_09795 [Sedimentisphaerales bacterium]|nr:hypothetical protein [Sedimentisphaerales bacterium]HRS11478.1 hypothetical protein [Sedimentisphaerales bacterium]HRV47984.1 hypothetical protein [Sedimentisphaerales bacterium]